MLSEKEEEILTSCLLPERLKRLESVLEHRTSSLTILLDQVQNYHNISAVLRSADAFGLSEINLVGSSFEYSTNIAQGSERWMKLRRHDSSRQARDYLIEQGYSLVVLEPEQHSATKDLPSRSIPVSKLPFEDKLALVFGNEHQGVSPELMAAATLHAFIPMHGFVESLNISVACAICLFCSTIGSCAPERRTPKLSPEEEQQLKQTWLQNSVRHSAEILQEVEIRKRTKAQPTLIPSRRTDEKVAE